MPDGGRKRGRRRLTPRLGVALAGSVVGVVLAFLLVGAGQAHLAVLSSGRYLSLAENGVALAGANSAWGDPKFNWYDELLNDTARSPQATIWGIVPLFEAVDDNALADPTTANLNLVKHFASTAETYWDVNVTPAPGVSQRTPAYAPYPNSSNDPETFFDDNAWFSLAFLDAYRVMISVKAPVLASQYLGDAVRGFNFIQANGWDSRDDGGMYWNTFHEIPGGQGRSGEALGGATDVAARLYQITGRSFYLSTAIQYITWANNNILKWDGSYATSITNEVTMPHDGEGAMIDAFTALCQSNAGAVPRTVYAQIPPNKTQGVNPSFRLPDDPTNWCSWAEALAHHTAYGVNPGGGPLDAYFPLGEGPQWDAIYIRALLTLYAYDHDASWYRLVATTAQQILTNAQGAGGLFLKDWDGSTRVPGADPGEIRTHGASVSVLAALAQAPAP